MTVVDEIRRKIQNLYRTDPRIHVCVSMNRPKVRVENQAARIVGVYPNIFRVESEGKTYTLQYKDIVTAGFRIIELEKDR